MAEILLFTEKSSFRFSRPTWFSWFRGRFYLLTFFILFILYILFGVVLYKILLQLETMELLMLRELSKCKNSAQRGCLQMQSSFDSFKADEVGEE